MRSEQKFEAFRKRMIDAGLPRQAIDSFHHHLSRYLNGKSGSLRESDILPIPILPDSTKFSSAGPTGESTLSRVVIIKLNGGLGTGMGLLKPKSLIRVRDDLSFLDLIALQTLDLRRRLNLRIPLILMNSYRTRKDSLEVIARYPDLPLDHLPMDFLQHRVPKVLESAQQPAEFPSHPEMEWCPPGHGDIYTALGTSGILNELMERGIEYAFISNADNLGAVLDTGILGYMVENDIDFLMEAADRTDSDRKGGHLCIRKGEGLTLRESAQCHPDEAQDFQNIRRHRYFNTNNLWIHLPSLAALMDHYEGSLPLTTIFNRKTLDPRDSTSPGVVHLETAMGAAISLFPNSAAVRVPRSRFSPVKSTSDLLAVRSDAYELTPDHRIIQSSDRNFPPRISLDPRFYRLLPDFEARFPSGPPSLRNCDSLEISGDITFGKGIRVNGSVRLMTPKQSAHIPDNARIEGDMSL